MDIISIIFSGLALIAIVFLTILTNHNLNVIASLEKENTTMLHNTHILHTFTETTVTTTLTSYPTYINDDGIELYIILPTHTDTEVGVIQHINMTRLDPDRMARFIAIVNQL